MAYQRYTPKRPVKSFIDLEVYQRLLAAGVVLFKRLEGDMGNRGNKGDKDNKGKQIRDALTAKQSSLQGTVRGEIKDKLLRTALNLPHQIALAHSLRFTELSKALRLLDQVMHDTNRVVVLLEQYRDLVAPAPAEVDFYNEQTQSYLRTRWKVMHLARSWENWGNRGDRGDKGNKGNRP